MKISTQYLEPGSNTAPEEAATVARIRITINNRSVTDFREGMENSLIPYVVMPTYPIADAIVHRWWTIVYGRGRATHLRLMRAGFALPDVTFVGDGHGHIDIKCEPFRYVNPPLEFVEHGEELIPVGEFEAELRGFIDNALKELAIKGVAETPLSARWSLINASAADSEEKAFCEAAGSLGVDPYTCDDSVAAFIESAATKFEGDALKELLAGVTPASGGNAIEWLKSAEGRGTDTAVLPAIGECKRRIGFRLSRSTERPWKVGYSSARIVRGTLGYSDTEPVGGLSQLAKRFGNDRFHATERSQTGLRGVSRILNDKPEAIVAGNQNPAPLLFAVARTIGDAIHFGSPQRSPVTDQEGTYRQSLGRAFAAEFLAPIRAVLEMERSGYPVDEIAENFGVSDMVIIHQIENRNNALSA